MPRHAAGVLPAPRDRARDRRDRRHDGRQRGDPVRPHRLRGRRRRGPRGRALLHELRRLRDDGGRAPRRRSARGARTASTSRRSSEWRKALTPRTRLVLLCNPGNPTGTVYRTGRARDGRAPSAARTGSSSWPTRCTASSSTTAARRRAPSACPGARRRRSSWTASRSATAPAASASAASPRATGTSTAPPCAWRRGASRPRASPSSWPSGRRARPRLREGHRARVPGAARRALRGSLADPGRLPAQARGCLLLRGAAARRRRRGLRLVAAHRLRPRGRAR